MNYKTLWRTQMRLHSLKIENINSLKGKHSISFLELAKESDLFAITGPTGSGKSTILISIMMALYGDHPKRLSAKDIVTTGEAFGKIECSFEHQRKLYNVLWECQVLKKNGEPKKNPSITRIVKRGQTPIDETIEEIIGLSFSQFTKVVILNQGQFSEFLTSSFKERKNLLENLLEDKNLKDLAVTLRKHLKDLESQMSHQKDILEATNVMPEKEEEESRQAYKAKTLYLKEKTIESKFYIEIIDFIEKLEKTIEKETEIKERKENKEKEKEEIYSVLTLLNKDHKIKSDQLESAKGNLKTRTPFLKKASENKNLLINLEEKTQDKHKRFKELKKDSLKTEKNILNTLTELKRKNEENEAYQRELKDFTLENLKKNLSFLEEINLIQKGQERTREESSRLSANLNDIEKKAQNLKKDYKKLKEEISQISCDHDFLNNIEREIESLKKEESIQQQVSFEKNSLTTQKEKITLEIQNLDSLISSKKTVIEGLLANKEELEKRVSLFKDNLKKLEFLTLGLEIDSQKCSFCLNDISKERVEYIKNKIKSEKTLVSEFEELKLEYEEKLSKINKYQGELNILKGSLLKAQANLIEVTENLNKLQTSEEKNFTELLKESEKQKDKYKDTQFKIEQIDHSIKELRSRWADESKRKEDIELEFKETDKKISVLTEKLPYPQLKKENNSQLVDKYISFSMLNEKVGSLKKELQFYQQEKEKQANQLSTLDGEIKAIEKEYNHALKVKRDEKYPDNPEEEQQSLINLIDKFEKLFLGIDKEKRDKEVEFSKVESSLGLLHEQKTENSKLYHLYCQNLNQAINNHPLHPDDSLYDSIEKLKTFTKAGDHETEAISLHQFREDKLLPYLENLLEKIELLKKETIILETRIKDNEEKKDKAGVITKNLAKLEERYNRFSLLSPYVDKDKFRDFALEILENNLLLLANKEILALADGRYQLQHAQAGQKNELLVLDLWQSGSHRKVSTLSGGETFLLSLGLALGLSEMTRGQTEIGSFFIDEGFGTLDNESIGLVLNCLLKMESKGKQIGVISHIKELTQQIPLRLNLIKNNFGEAQIEYY